MRVWVETLKPSLFVVGSGGLEACEFDDGDDYEEVANLGKYELH